MPFDDPLARTPAAGADSVDGGDRKPAVAGAPEEAVRGQLERVLESPGFRYSERLSRFLRFVVEQQLAGNPGQLKESVLAVEIFDRPTSYDPHVDSIVRVEARRLRAKLEHYYGSAGREDPVILALPKGSYAPVFALRERLPVAAAGLPAPPPTTVHRGPRQVSLRVFVAMAFVCVAAGVALTTGIGLRRVPPLRFERLTADSGLTFEPTLSPDGKLLAYSSDRGGTGHLEIWVQQIAGGSPVRITSGPGEDREPSFSPDGTLIAYRAEGEAAGVYVVPALGGMSTLLAAGGYRPRFSPDGARVAYWIGERSFRTAKVYVTPVKGGSPVRLRPEFTYAAYPIWSPDGREVLFVGSQDPSTKPWDSAAADWDWWIAPVDGGPAVQTFARRTFAKQGLQPPQTGWSHRRIVPSWWTAAGEILFPARTGERMNIWQVPVSRAGRIFGPARQVTFGAGRQDYPAVSADGTIAFSVLTSKSDIHALPVDANSGSVRGPAVRLTSDSANYTRPAVSADGKRMAFLSNRAGNYDVWVKDLAGGRESSITATREDESVVVLSPDGAKIAYGYTAPLSPAIFTVGFAGGRAAQLCPACGEPRAWLPDGSGLLFQRFTPSGVSMIGVLDPSGHESVLMHSQESALFSPSVSPDGRWLALIVRTPPDDHRVMVAGLRGRTADARQAWPAWFMMAGSWVSVTQRGAWVDKPRWSPDGNLLYYLSDRDGFLCIWAQRLHPLSKAPVGAPLEIAHFHDRHSPGTVFGMELSVATDKLVFNVGEDSGNLWIARAGR